jgi:hypothetical protein
MMYPAGVAMGGGSPVMMMAPSMGGMPNGAFSQGPDYGYLSAQGSMLDLMSGAWRYFSISDWGFS